MISALWPFSRGTGCVSLDTPECSNGRRDGRTMQCDARLAPSHYHRFASPCVITTQRALVDAVGIELTPRRKGRSVRGIVGSTAADTRTSTRR